MCGICGILRLDGGPADGLLLDRMNDTLAHRGPDGAGTYSDGPIALGHRRLSIIDLSTGDQPMTTADGDLTVVFNGEIYNYQELRAELSAKGHVFRTSSDTESILHGYREWGAACVERLRGMFAFGLWDRRRRRLVLARDRLGKKPLYYHHGKDRFLFASELKAILQDVTVPRDMDPQSLDLYLSFGYVPSPRSIHSRVNKLPPAHVAVLDEQGLVMRRYWRLRMSGENEPRPSFEAASEQLAAIFDEAVRLRLMSDVPLGAFLSGGVDSSAVVASMALADPGRPVRTAAIGFSERAYDELDHARIVAERYGTDHSEFTVEADAADIARRLVRHFDEPFADSSAIPTYHVSRMAREKVTVALSGDGGDEVFAGYARRYGMVRLEDRLRNALPAALRHGLLRPLGRMYPRAGALPRPLRLKHFFGNLGRDLPEAYARDMSFYFKPEDKARLYTRDLARLVDADAARSYLGKFFAECEGCDAVSRVQYVDMMTYMTEDILVKVDRMSMAVSLEVRSPLLDHGLLEFAASLPADFKLRGATSKAVFKHMNAGRLSPELLTRRKQGFRLPISEWLRGDLRQLCEEAVFSPSSDLSAYLDLRHARKLLSAHVQGREDNANQLWALTMLGLWRQDLAPAQADPSRIRTHHGISIRSEQ